MLTCAACAGGGPHALVHACTQAPARQRRFWDCSPSSCTLGPKGHIAPACQLGGCKASARDPWILVAASLLISGRLCGSRAGCLEGLTTGEQAPPSPACTVHLASFSGNNSIVPTFFVHFRSTVLPPSMADPSQTYGLLHQTLPRRIGNAEGTKARVLVSARTMCDGIIRCAGTQPEML